jgi:hypothetical protein
MTVEAAIVFIQGRWRSQDLYCIAELQVCSTIPMDQSNMMRRDIAD